MNVTTVLTGCISLTTCQVNMTKTGMLEMWSIVAVKLKRPQHLGRKVYLSRQVKRLRPNGATYQNMK